MFRYGIYKSLLTNKKTMFIASRGDFPTKDYLEYQISIIGGKWAVLSTDGYKPAKLVKLYSKSENLKNIINDLKGYANEI